MSPVAPRMALLAIGILGATAPAQAQVVDELLDVNRWKARVSLGVDYAPRYEGDDDLSFKIIPGADLLWNDLVFIRTVGGVIQRQHDGLQFGASFLPEANLQVELGGQIRRGRDSGDSDSLRGTPDRDSSHELFVSAAYAWDYYRVDGSIHKGFDLFTDGHDGWLFKGGLTLGARFRPELDGWVRGGLTWGSEGYVGFFFGTPGVNPEGGLTNLDITLGATYRLTGNISLNGRLGYSALLSDAADSALVQSGHQFSLGTGVQYDF